MMNNELIIGIAPLATEAKVTIATTHVETECSPTPRDIKEAILAIGCTGAQSSLDMALLADKFMRESYVEPQPEQWRGRGKRRMKRVK